MSQTQTQRAIYRLAAMDLDDTLLCKEKRISAENVAAVERLRAGGVRVLLASGRKHESMLRFHRALGLDGLLVSCQGALVKHAESGEVIHEQGVAPELAAELVALVEREGGTLAYYHSEGIYVSRLNHFTKLYQSRGGDGLVECGDLNRLAGKSPLKMIWIDEPARTQARLADAQAQYAGKFELVVTSPEYLEFNACGISKAIGLAAAAAFYGIDRTEALAFGDADNDVTMLRWAGCGVAMSVATAAARAAADLHTPPGDAATSLARAVELVWG